METSAQRSHPAEHKTSEAVAAALLERIFQEIGVDANTVIIDVNDIDKTAVTKGIERDGIKHPTPHFISPVLLASMQRHQEVAKKLGATYAGFCLQTHRGLNFEFYLGAQGKEKGAVGKSIASLKNISALCLDHDSYAGIKHKYSREYAHINMDDLFTPSVAKNLAKLTGTPCLGIGTIDDLVENRQFGQGHEECNAWYTALLASKYLHQPTKRLSYTPPPYHEYKFNPTQDTATKNPQHELLIAAMRAKFPGKKLLFIYNEDKKALCQQTLALTPQKDVAFVVFQHYARKQQPPLYHGYQSGFKLTHELGAANTVPEVKSKPVASGVQVPPAPMETSSPAHIRRSLKRAHSPGQEGTPAPQQRNGYALTVEAREEDNVKAFYKKQKRMNAQPNPELPENPSPRAQHR